MCGVSTINSDKHTMRKNLIFLFFILFFACCETNDNQSPNNQNRGSLVLKMTYNSSKTASNIRARNISNTASYYTQFGDYITSISPTVFIEKFLDMRLFSWEKTDNKMLDAISFNVIDNNTPMDSCNRIADFSGNASVNFNVDLSYITGMAIDSVVFNIFVFMSMFYYQEFNIPQEYNSVPELTYLCFNTEHINFATSEVGGYRDGLAVKGVSTPFIAPAFIPNWTGNYSGADFTSFPWCYVLGSCDSTYIWKSTINGVEAESIDNPIGQGGVLIRSSAFNNITLHFPKNGETKNLIGTMTFDTTDLIQVYAGTDNIPFTSDDIFVYAPRYWERISVNLISE